MRLVEDIDYDIKPMEKQSRSSVSLNCPHCEGTKIKKNVIIKNVQRYFCNECNKNFRSNTGSATLYLQKNEKFKRYIPYFLTEHSICKCAELTEIFIQTSFDWRHKILLAFNKKQEVFLISGFCESDDIFFTYSKKRFLFIRTSNL